MKNLGLYIHIPFCLSKCRYCDFCTLPHPKPETVKSYLSSLCGEIEEQSRDFTQYSVDTVYFGGGTPTSLSADELCAVLLKLRKHFNIIDDAEITAECNPKTADLEYFKTVRYAGINRLSIGVQSMNKEELKTLGRLHSPADIEKSFADARAAGFENISADIMLALPGQTKESLAETVERVCSLSPAHVSLYGLKIEEGTYFGKHKSELILPDEDSEYEMYLTCKEILSKNRFERYEISNYARDGKASRHNLKYWHREDYLGLGVAAHSCIGDKRFSNTTDIVKYCSANRADANDIISTNDILCEKVMLGMRLDEGCDFASLETEFGEKANEIFSALIKHTKDGYVNQNQKRLSFSDKGMYVSNYLLGEVLNFDN